MKWTTSDIPEQTGKIVVITGANAGIGRATTRALSNKGAEVVMAVRTVANGEKAADEIRAEQPDAELHVMALDLSKLSSVRAFAADFLASFDQLDVLINNAGVYGGGTEATAEGFSMSMGVNHLGHFALTGLLLERLLGTPQSRVVTLSSGIHSSGKIDLETFHTVEAAQKGAYGSSKLANMLFMLELQRKLEGTNTTTISVAAGPGATKSDGAQNGIQSISNRFLRSAADALTDIIMLSSEEGASPVLRAATDPQAKGGEYYTLGGFMGMRGNPVAKEPAKSAHDEALAQGLWARSVALTGVEYSALQGEKHR